MVLCRPDLTLRPMSSPRRTCSGIFFEYPCINDRAVFWLPLTEHSARSICTRGGQRAGCRTSRRSSCHQLVRNRPAKPENDRVIRIEPGERPTCLTGVSAQIRAGWAALEIPDLVRLVWLGGRDSNPDTVSPENRARDSARSFPCVFSRFRRNHLLSAAFRAGAFSCSVSH